MDGKASVQMTLALSASHCRAYSSSGVPPFLQWITLPKAFSFANSLRQIKCYEGQALARQDNSTIFPHDSRHISYKCGCVCHWLSRPAGLNNLRPEAKLTRKSAGCRFLTSFEPKLSLCVQVQDVGFLSSLKLCVKKDVQSTTRLFLLSFIF